MHSISDGENKTIKFVTISSEHCRNSLTNYCVYKRVPCATTILELTHAYRKNKQKVLFILQFSNINLWKIFVIVNLCRLKILVNYLVNQLF